MTLLKRSRCVCGSYLLPTSKRRLLSTALSREDFTPANPKDSPDLLSKPFRLAIVGSGPSGFYAASRILSFKGSENVKVDLFEQLPVPYGLVRFGVAPDHPEVKNCQHKFDQTAQDHRFRFFGNVKIGSTNPTSDAHGHLSVDFLRNRYHSVLFAYGADHEKSLGVPGETDLANIHSAKSFVNFYNGHPSNQFQPDLSHTRHVTIIGQGNVAVDCARMLLMNVDQLTSTDCTHDALRTLRSSAVERVDIVGRRGVLQASFTTKELREFTALSGVLIELDAEQLSRAMSALKAGYDRADKRMKSRILDILHRIKPLTSPKRIGRLEFFKSPVEFISDGHGRVSAVKWEINDVVDDRVVKTGRFVTTSTDLILTSIGYRSTSVEGLPFDNALGIMPNIQGRVVDSNKQSLPGVYVSGWLATGPRGVIATTMMDAFITAETITRDYLANDPGPRDDLSVKAVREALEGGRVVTWSDWQLIEQEEIRRGRDLDKEREKIPTVDEMLSILP